MWKWFDEAEAKSSGAPLRREHLLALLVGLAVVLAPVAARAESHGNLLEPSSADGTIHLRRLTNGADVLQRMELERGKSVVIETDFSVKRMSVGDPAVLDVVVLGTKRLQVVPKLIGDTNVVVWDASNRAQAVIDVHVGTPHSQIEVEIQRVLGNDTIRVDGAGESILLKGSVADAVAMDMALKTAHAFFPEKPEDHVVNLVEIGGDQQVMIEIKIAEMNRDVRRRLGTNFEFDKLGNFKLFSFLDGLTGPDAITSAGKATTDVLNLSDRINLVGSWFDSSDFVLDVFMELLDEKGLAKILAEPTLVARSGERAKFLVGGEIPIPIAQGGAFGSITIEFKEFGVGVEFTPTVLHSKRIHMRVSPEVSEVDHNLGIEISGIVIPGFRTRRASTGIELADGQTFAIAGLLRDDVKELVNQFPVLGDVPVLGGLFRSSRFQRNETELVLIVTPHLVHPLGVGPHPLPTDHFVEPNKSEFFLLGALEGRRPSQVAGDEEMLSEGSLGATEAPLPQVVSELPQVQDAVPGAEEPAFGGVIGDFGHRVSVSAAERDKR